MGTTCGIIFNEGAPVFERRWGATKVVATIFSSKEGYYGGYGLLLAEFLAGKTMINGITDYSDRYANGTGCLAAQCVKFLKKGVGGIGLCSELTINDYKQIEYIYHVYTDTLHPEYGIEIHAGDDELRFVGTPTGFLKFCKENDF